MPPRVAASAFAGTRTLFRDRPVAFAGFLWLGTVVACALVGPLLVPFDPLEISPLDRLAEPGAAHWFGTDHFGRDTFSRTVVGARMALVIGLGTVVVALGAGTLVGMLSAWFPRLGHVLMRVVDVAMAFPALLLALVLMTLLERSVVNTIIVIGIVYTTTTARILYGLTLKIRREVFIDAALCSGAGHASLLFRHALPNLVSPLLVQASFVFAFAQLQAAALDFLGLGLPPEIPSWGNMLAESRTYITRASWLLIFPGAAIILTVFSMNLVGDALRDRIDPRFRDGVAKV